MMRALPSTPIMLVGLLLTGIPLTSGACRSEQREPPAILLSHRPDLLVDVQLPPSRRPSPPAEWLSIPGPFDKVDQDEDGVLYESPLPLRQMYRWFGRKAKPSALDLRESDGQPLRFSSSLTRATGAHRWTLVGAEGAHRFQVRLPADAPPPTAASWQVRYPPALEAELRLNFEPSADQAEGFAIRSTTIDGELVRGLYLPAPARSEWDLEVPSGSKKPVLDFRAHLLPPVVDAEVHSDGASVVVEATLPDGTLRELSRTELEVGEEKRVRVSLGELAGQPTRLVVRTEPGEHGWLDYVFLAEPTVLVPQGKPHQLLLVFIDTLRADHLEVYGYQRDTMPKLARWADDAIVFEQARSVAPWTLPSVRALLAGRQPEHWSDGATLHEALAAGGWTTGAIVANAYLSDTMGMAEGWSHHALHHLAPAPDQVERAIDLLDAHDDRDFALMVQFMEPHLPYAEPDEYRDLWEGERIERLEGRLTRGDLVRLGSNPPGSYRSHIVGRYDQNLRYLDDQLAELLDEVDEDATVVVFSDHGEEFWEHEGVEHGHALWDEVLHVPLLIKAPGQAARRISDPVSLVDVAPTILQLLGLPNDDWDGRTVLDGIDRPEAYGRTLYGDEAWGARVGSRKWVSSGTSQHIFDLASDPTESRPQVVDFAPFHAALSDALDQDVVEAWRVVLDGKHRKASDPELKVQVLHPDGFGKVWNRYDPLGDLSVPSIDQTTLTIEQGDEGVLPREVFVQPAGPAEALELVVSRGTSETRTACCKNDKTLIRTGRGRSEVVITTAISPVGKQLETTRPDEETRDGLRALGYLDED